MAKTTSNININIANSVTAKSDQIISIDTYNVQNQSVATSKNILNVNGGVNVTKTQPLPSNVTLPKPFGSYANKKYEPLNDSIQLDIYSSSDLLLETIPRASFYSINGTTLDIDIEAELKQAQYLAGDFTINAKLLRNVLGSIDGYKTIIQDISSDRLEVRVRPGQLVSSDPNEAATLNIANNNFQNWFREGFFTLDKQSILSNLYLQASPTEEIGVFDYIQDRITFPNDP